jgi:hypothetical protein
LYILSQSWEILLALRAKSFEAKHLRETQGKIRKRVLLATKWRFLSLVDLSHPMKESRDLTDQAAEPLRAVGSTSRKPILSKRRVYHL